MSALRRSDKENRQEILLKMNLPDHMSVLTDPEVHLKMEMEIPRSSRVNSHPLFAPLNVYYQRLFMTNERPTTQLSQL
ncbi:hypothetical protein Tco_1081388 [Tanacetum coccineum]|uniref:Uncharacterized protein n=1 Tax=Tanacetum coccineum TaxID=301880 RepID=A0ABQ5HZE8_9ASTR